MSLRCTSSCLLPCYPFGVCVWDARACVTPCAAPNASSRVTVPCSAQWTLSDVAFVEFNVSGSSGAVKSGLRTHVMDALCQQSWACRPGHSCQSTSQAQVGVPHGLALGIASLGRPVQESAPRHIRVSSIASAVFSSSFPFYVLPDPTGVSVGSVPRWAVQPRGRWHRGLPPVHRQQVQRCPWHSCVQHLPQRGPVHQRRGHKLHRQVHSWPLQPQRHLPLRSLSPRHIQQQLRTDPVHDVPG